MNRFFLYFFGKLSQVLGSGFPGIAYLGGYLLDDAANNLVDDAGNKLIHYDRNR